MSKKTSKHTKKKIKNNKSYKKIAFVVILLLIIIIGIKNSKKETKNEQTELILNNENITNELSDGILKQNEEIYISFNDVQKFIDNTIYKEEGTDLIITTSPKKVATFKEGQDTININGSSQKEKNIVIKEDDKDYIAISELENVYDYEFKYVSASNIITIDSLNKKFVKVYAKKKIKVKEENKLFSKTIDKVEKGNCVVFIGKENGMAKIRTQSGKIGYVKEKYLDNYVTEREDLNESTDQIGNELEYDISKKDITTYEKRENIINLILQEAIKNGKMYVKIIYNGTEEANYNRFKIESVPLLNECGIKVEF